jgi:hypothetical protein
MGAEARLSGMRRCKKRCRLVNTAPVEIDTVVRVSFVMRFTRGLANMVVHG